MVLATYNEALNDQGNFVVNGYSALATHHLFNFYKSYWSIRTAACYFKIILITMGPWCGLTSQHI